MMAEWNINTPNSEFLNHQSKELPSLVREIIATPEIAIDTETTGLDNFSDLPLYWSLGWGSRKVTMNISTLPYFEEAFKDPKKRWIFANAKYDSHMLANVGMNIAGEMVDTQVMHALLYEERSHKLKDMNYHLFGWRWTDFEDTFGKIGKRQTAEDRIRKAERENFDLLVEYASNDAWGTWLIYLELKKQLELANTHSLFIDKPPYITTLWDLFNKIEVPYTKVLWKNERRGILMDREYLGRIAPIAQQEIQQLERAIFREAGRAINPSSPQQLREYFFDQLGLPVTKVTKGGKSGIKLPSVDESFLDKHANDVPMAALILKHRKLSKLYGTYIEGISNLLDDNGRAHTTYNQDVTRTGRLSSKKPNLQNIPNPEFDKWKLRGAFIASPGYELIGADYEQLEMRLLACASLDQGMIDVINRGWDIHMGNASLMFGIDYEEIKAAKKVDKEVKAGNLPESAITERIAYCLQARYIAKTNGFALIYGQGLNALARALNRTKEQTAELIRQFNEAMPAAQAFKIEAIAETERTGYAFTIMGRRRNVPQILSHSHEERAQGERIAVNTQIQGSAADVVKVAQILLDKSGIDRRFDCHSMLQVHDEIIHECPKELAQEARAEIKDWMEHPFCMDLAVPLEVDINTGHSWLEVK